MDETALIPIRPTKPKRIPTVLSRDEAKKVIAKMDGIYKLMTQIRYGSGLRLMEVMRLRVKALSCEVLAEGARRRDLDFANHQTEISQCQP